MGCHMGTTGKLAKPYSLLPKRKPARQCLGRTQPVKSIRIIRPKWVAEIRRTTNQRVCSQRKPNRIGQACASLDNNNQIGRSCDGESELIRAHAEARIARLCLWIP